MSFFSSSRILRGAARVVAFTVLTGTVAFAGDVPLTLSDALARAEARNPALLAERFNEAVAEGLLEQAALRPNPTLDVELENFLGTGEQRGIHSLEGTVLASQTIERGNKRQRRVDLATRERDVAIAEFQVRRAGVLAATATAYIDVVAAEHRAKLAAEPSALARDTLKAVTARVEAGMGSPTEIARTRALVAAAEIEEMRAKSTLAAARAALAAQWGETDGESVQVRGEWMLPVQLPQREAFLARIASAPALRLEQVRIAVRLAALEVEQSRSVQDISVGAGLRLLRPEDDAALVASVSIPLPVRDRNQGAIRAAREFVAQSEQSLRGAETDLRVQFSAAWAEIMTASAAVQKLRHDALPATEEAFGSVRTAYEQGQLPLVDVLDAQRALTELRREIGEADAAVARAIVRAESLVDPSFTYTRTLISQP